MDGIDFNMLTTFKARSALLTPSSGKTLVAIPQSRLKTRSDQAFFVRAPILWDNLPKEIRLVESLTSFKSFLKTCFLEVCFSRFCGLNLNCICWLLLEGSFNFFDFFLNALFLYLAIFSLIVVKQLKMLFIIVRKM